MKLIKNLKQIISIYRFNSFRKALFRFTYHLSSKVPEDGDLSLYGDLEL